MRPITTIVANANSLDPDEMLSNLASQLDPSCLTLGQQFHQLSAKLKHFENLSRWENWQTTIYLAGLGLIACLSVALETKLLIKKVKATFPGENNFVNHVGLFFPLPLQLRRSEPYNFQRASWLLIKTCCVSHYKDWLLSLWRLFTLCMLGNFFKYFFLSKEAKNHCFLPNILLIYNLNVKQFGSQMKPHKMWGFIWIQIVCIGHQRSSKFTASGLRVNQQNV